MERRGEDGGYSQDSGAHHHVKLPLAAILSSSQDRRGGYLPSSRRGSSIFSPTQTLDHHRHHLNPPPPLPDPDPPTPTTDDGASNSKIPASPPRPPPPPPPPPSTSANNTSNITRYRECLKNHAATMGGHVVDGCGEFMPSGDDGTAEALRCAACDCHRNFHRKEIDGGEQHINRTPAIGMCSQNPPPHHKAPAMVNFGGDESSSEDLNAFQSRSDGGGRHAGRESGSKKRFRTKFSQQQKDRMQEVAEKIGWRIQKQDEEAVQKLCNESGIKRQVFKVWMHNNKQAMKKRHQISD